MKNGRLMRWLTVTAAVLVAAFFVYKAVSVVADEFDTVSAEMTTVYDSVDIDAFAVRDETLLYYNGGGTVVSTAKNAEKVTGTSSVALIFTTETEAENYIELSYLNDLLDGYKKIDSQLVLANVDTDLLGENIEDDFDAISEAVYSGKFKDLSDKKLDFLVDLSKRQISFGKEIDCDAMISELNAKIALTEKSATPKSSVNAGKSGYYVSAADGFEKTVAFDSLDTLTSGAIEKALAAKPADVADNCVGKIVGGFNWYLVSSVDSKLAARLTEGSEYKVIFGNNSSDYVLAKVYRLNKEKDGKTAVVLKCNSINAERLSMRRVNAKIVIEEYSGLRVPKSAVRVIDDKNCAFVRVGKVTKQRELDIVYNGDDFVIADPDSESTGSAGIKNHDAVIINGKGLG